MAKTFTFIIFRQPIPLFSTHLPVEPPHHSTFSIFLFFYFSIFLLFYTMLSFFFFYNYELFWKMKKTEKKRGELSCTTIKKFFIHFPFPSYVVLYNVSHFAIGANYQLTLRIVKRLFLLKEFKRQDKCIVTFCNVNFEQNTTVDCIASVVHI